MDEIRAHSVSGISALGELMALNSDWHKRITALAAGGEASVNSVPDQQSAIDVGVCDACQALPVILSLLAIRCKSRSNQLT